MFYGLGSLGYYWADPKLKKSRPATALFFGSFIFSTSFYKLQCDKPILGTPIIHSEQNCRTGTGLNLSGF